MTFLKFNSWRLILVYNVYRTPTSMILGTFR